MATIMALFRFHRGSLAESLKTTIIVKTFNEMVKAILFDASLSNLLDVNPPPWGAKFLIEPYPGYDNFDPRIGWYTQIVTANIYEENKMHPIGFLSEPFER